ncbi:MAG TPA: DUF6580 family putative transport protein [Rhizomicrobium sp.]|jgi:hypothetical protein
MAKPRIMLVVSFILAAALTRLLPHPPNMTSIAAVALFGGAYLEDRRLAFLIPIGALLLSDLLIGFYHPMAVASVYASFALTVCIGFWLRTHRGALTIAAAALASSILFFAVTNFEYWAFENAYPKTLEGLMACYTAALPFFRNTVVGDLLYAGLLFGGFALLERRFPAFRPPAALPA